MNSSNNNSNNSFPLVHNNIPTFFRNSNQLPLNSNSNRTLVSVTHPYFELIPQEVIHGSDLNGAQSEEIFVGTPLDVNSNIIREQVVQHPAALPHSVNVNPNVNQNVNPYISNEIQILPQSKL